MKLHVGTSGYNYPEWRGSFYPAGFPTSKMLVYYAERFSTVEINYTFYHMPTEKALLNWARETPDNFTFTLKAPRRITHNSRLKHCEDLVDLFITRAAVLGQKLGILLFQVAPSHRKDVDTLNAFMDLLPEGIRAAFEFRHTSWHSEDVYDALRDRNMAMCVTDSETLSTPTVTTAGYGYFRLRDEGYEPSDIQRWGDTVLAQQASWPEAFVYFKHKAEGKGPEFARTFLDSVSAKSR